MGRVRESANKYLVHMVSEFRWRQLEIEHRNHGLKLPDRGVARPLISKWEPVPDTKTRPHRTLLGSLLWHLDTMYRTYVRRPPF